MLVAYIWARGRGSIRPTWCLLDACWMSAWRLLDVCSMSARCLLAVCSTFAWCLLDVCYALCMLYICSMFARCLLDVCSISAWSCKWVLAIVDVEASVCACLCVCVCLTAALCQNGASYDHEIFAVGCTETLVLESVKFLQIYRRNSRSAASIEGAKW